MLNQYKNLPSLSSEEMKNIKGGLGPIYKGFHCTDSFGTSYNECLLPSEDPYLCVYPGYTLSCTYTGPCNPYTGVLCA